MVRLLFSAYLAAVGIYIFAATPIVSIIIFIVVGYAYADKRDA